MPLTLKKIHTGKIVLVTKNVSRINLSVKHLLLSSVFKIYSKFFSLLNPTKLFYYGTNRDFRFSRNYFII